MLFKQCYPQTTSYTQMISMIMYILTMLYVLFTYYNRANELVIEVCPFGRFVWRYLISIRDSFTERACIAGCLQCAMV